MDNSVNKSVKMFPKDEFQNINGMHAKEMFTQVATKQSTTKHYC